MAKKKKSRKKNGQGQATPAGQPWHRSTGVRIAILIAVAAALFLVWRWSLEYRAGRAFLDHARLGQAALVEVERPADEGTTGHSTPGESLRYQNDPPTSGRHNPKWIDPGIYQTVQPNDRLVHSLEHGMVVVYFDKPSPAVWETLTTWAGLYTNTWSGIVLAPKPGLGETVILTAWRKLMRLDGFDAETAAAFIDAYRGRGPEHPVR